MSLRSDPLRQDEVDIFEVIADPQDSFKCTKGPFERYIRLYYGHGDVETSGKGRLLSVRGEWCIS